jgi:hypothetical protein
MSRPVGLRQLRRRNKAYTSRGPLLSFRSTSEYVQAERDARRHPISPGFCALQRFKVAGSDLPRVYLARVAAPSEFLTLLTLSSSRNRSALFHAKTLLGFNSSEDSPSTAGSCLTERTHPRDVGCQRRPAAILQTASPAFRAFLRGSPLPCRSKPGRPVPLLSFPPLQGRATGSRLN